jgi:hypothetical protein
MAGHNWTPEKLSALDLSKLKNVQENALRNAVPDLLDMCASEIASRKKVTPSRHSISPAKAESGDIVTEYHFVCRNDRGVTFNPDGTFWSTSWVVADDVIKKSLRFGARFALHNSKQEPSYRQGLIKDYRRIQDFADGKVESRVDFLVLSEPQPLEWAGSGAGEKGYKRAKSSGNETTPNVEAGKSS